MATNDFWGQLGGGLLTAGAGYLGSKSAEKAAEEKRRQAEDPLFQKMEGAAGQSMTLAGGMDPKAHAAERFKAQQALVEPGNEAARLKLMRELQKKGLLGVASSAPVPGTAPAPGAGPMNPHLAALYAAQEGAKAQSAYGALQEGESYLDRLLERGGMLSKGAQARRAGNLAAAPAKAPSIGTTLLSAIGGSIANNPGMIGQGLDWLTKQFGGGATPTPQLPMEYGMDYGLPQFEMPKFEMPTFDDWYGGYSTSDWGYGW